LKLDLGVKFDVVCSIASIEHVDSPLEFACRIKDLLLPGGIAFIVTDNDDGMIYAAARLLRKVGIRAPYDRLYMAHHLQCFSRKSLRMLVENCGLRVISHKDHNHPVAAVDYPDADIILKAIYAAAVRIIFGLSGLFRTGILQVVVCRKD
jgi:SAM-dependent methyltransferase